jgi:hypothetical protein
MESSSFVPFGDFIRSCIYCFMYWHKV